MNLLRFLALCIITGCAFATWATCEPPPREENPYKPLNLKQPATISKVSGPAAEDFVEHAKVLVWKESTLEEGWYEEKRLHDAADALGRALLLNDAKDIFPTLCVRVLP